jgi:hypothetical protein
MASIGRAKKTDVDGADRYELPHQGVMGGEKNSLLRTRDAAVA